MRGDLLAAFSQGTTVCHRLPPRLKVLLTLAVIAAGILIPPASWPLLGCLGCVIFGQLMRWNLVPESVCLECSDITRRVAARG